MIDKIKRFENFIAGNKEDYFSEVINLIINNFKKQYKIDLSSKYDFEIFLHLQACYTVFGSIHKTNLLIFIDEFQDYAASELLLYKKVFPNAVLNLFGDIKQSISAKGLIEDEINLVTDNKWRKFSINENYRNARQITEYINKEFGLVMMPIGIDGSVHHIDNNHLCDNFHLDESDRIAFVVKDIPLFEEIFETRPFIENEKINLIIDDECGVLKGYLNVIPINLVKGLEFEQVYVLPNQMTENEKYVAFTRALSKLYILN
jgi:DNA helicase IV